MKQALASSLLALLLTAACATTPASTPELAARAFELDPRAGWTAPPGLTSQAASYEKAARDLAAGRRDRAEQRLADLERRSPAYAPAGLALAALALESGNLAAAAPKIEAAAKAQPGWTAAEYYMARAEADGGDLEGAAARLRKLAAAPGAAGVIADRLAAVETRLFDRLFQSAAGAPPPAAITSLRRALAIRPESTSARLLLVQKLVAASNFAEARMEIDPLLQAADAERPEVQQALAEIDAGRGRYEEAIERYERILRREPRPEYLSRLEQIKQEFAIANMPPRFRAAAASPQMTRAELATLVYWTVSGVRFGRPPAEPAVAVDIDAVEARDEIVRAIAFGLFNVDPLTRRVDPHRTMTAASIARLLLRVTALTSTPACLSSPGADGSTLNGIANILEGCGIETSALRGSPEAPVSGAWALAALLKIDAMRVR